MAKPSKSAKTERQRLIDETLKKQRSAEKRRGNVIIGTAVVVALAILGVAVAPQVIGKIKESEYADEPVGQVGAPASVCQDVQEKEATGVSNHVDPPEKVTYEAAPPAFGPHWNSSNPPAPAPFEEKFYDAQDRPELEQLVHNLEHGYTILWYDESIADDSTQLAQIRSIATKFDGSVDDLNFRLKFIAAPWTDADEGGKKFPDGQHVAFTHWKGDAQKSIGVTQYCSEVSGEALLDFMDAYPYTDAPEAGVI